MEKKGCEHVKSLAQSEATLSTEDIKDPSPEASMVGGKFFTDIWDNSGRELAQEIIQRSEKGIHDAREVVYQGCVRVPRCVSKGLTGYATRAES